MFIGTAFCLLGVHLDFSVSLPVLKSANSLHRFLKKYNGLLSFGADGFDEKSFRKIAVLCEIFEKSKGCFGKKVVAIFVKNRIVFKRLRCYTKACTPILT